MPPMPPMPGPTDDHGATPARLRVADLNPRKPNDFALAPDAQVRAQIARALGVTEVPKLSFRGSVRAEGRADWRLEARLGASVVQPCVVSLAPVTTRIDTDVTRRFLQEWQAPDPADESPLPEDVSTEHLQDSIDLIAVLREALALSLPDYPRHPDAELAQSDFAAEGVTPLRDEDTKPFAGLAALKRSLEDPQE